MKWIILKSAKRGYNGKNKIYKGREGKDVKNWFTCFDEWKKHAFSCK